MRDVGEALRFRTRQVAALRGLLAQRTAERDEARALTEAALAEFDRATAAHDTAVRERDAALAELQAARDAAARSWWRRGRT